MQSKCIQHPPGKHKDRKNILGDFQLRLTWRTNKNLVTNTILSCLLQNQCNCPCQAKIIETPVQIILFIADIHTAADHVGSKDRSKFLKHPETFDCLCSQGGASTQSRRTYLQCSKFTHEGNRCCSSKIGRAPCSQSETPDRFYSARRTCCEQYNQQLGKIG